MKGETAKTKSEHENAMTAGIEASQMAQQT